MPPQAVAEQRAYYLAAVHEPVHVSTPADMVERLRDRVKVCWDSMIADAEQNYKSSYTLRPTTRCSSTSSARWIPASARLHSTHKYCITLVDGYSPLRPASSVDAQVGSRRHGRLPSLGRVLHFSSRRVHGQRPRLLGGDVPGRAARVRLRPRPCALPTRTIRWVSWSARTSPSPMPSASSAGTHPRNGSTSSSSSPRGATRRLP